MNIQAWFLATTLMTASATALAGGMHGGGMMSGSGGMRPMYPEMHRQTREQVQDHNRTMEGHAREPAGSHHDAAHPTPQGMGGTADMADEGHSASHSAGPGPAAGSTSESDDERIQGLDR